MITVITRWEDGWFGDLEIEAELWLQTCKAYNVDKLIFVPKLLSDRGYFDQYDTMAEAIDSVDKDTTRVFLEPAKTAWIEHSRSWTDLETYNHEENSVYIYGTSYKNNMSEVTDDDTIVSIEFPNATRGVFGMVVNGIVLRDRWMKK